MARQATPDLLGDPVPADDPSLEAIIGPQMQRIATVLIRLDGGTQPRAGIDQAMVDDYHADMANGAVFPPVELVYDGKDYWLWDGFHRYHAFRRDGDRTIPANVRQGTRRDAVLLSVGANATHGLRRTNADKRRAVMALLEDEEWRQWSNLEIARRCAVSDRFVGEIRKELTPNGSESTIRRGSDGRTINTANIGKRLTVRELELLVSQYLDESDQSESGPTAQPYDGQQFRDIILWMNGRTNSRPWRSLDLSLARDNVLEQRRRQQRSKQSQPTPPPTGMTYLTPDQLVMLVDQWCDEYPDPDDQLRKLDNDLSLSAETQQAQLTRTYSDWITWYRGKASWPGPFRDEDLLTAVRALRLRETPEEEVVQPDSELVSTIKRPALTWPSSTKQVSIGQIEVKHLPDQRKILIVPNGSSKQIWIELIPDQAQWLAEVLVQ